MAKRYNKLSLQTWGDEKFARLSRMRPSGQDLWLFLLLGPLRKVMPGLIVHCGIGVLSDGLRWSIAATKKCWSEIEQQEMAKSDWKSGVIWLPRALVHNEPDSPNVVSYWRSQFNDLAPNCELTNEAESAAVAFLTQMGDAWIDAWEMGPDSRDSEARLRRWLRADPTLRDQIKVRDSDRCRYCGEIVNWKDRRGKTAGSYDHVDPRLGNDLTNVVTACRSCNSRKGRRTPTQAGMRLLEPGSGPELNLDLPLGISGNQEQYRDPDLDDHGTYSGAGAPRFPKAVEKDNSRPVASDWKRALAIAHTVIEQFPSEPSNWSPETKGRLQEQHIDPRQRSPRGGYLFHDAVDYAVQQRTERGERITRLKGLA